MKNYKKITIICFLGVILILGSVWFFTSSRLYFQKDAVIEIYAVIYNASENQSEEVTDRVDLEKLESLLRSIQCKRYRTSFAPFWRGDVQYEIDGAYNNELFHVLVGTSDVNCVYVSGDRGGYKILNRDYLIENIAGLLQGH